MSNLTDRIEGYEIVVAVRPAPDHYRQVVTIPLRLNQVGGAHVTNPEDLIRQIEDAVFNDRNTR